MPAIVYTKYVNVKNGGIVNHCTGIRIKFGDSPSDADSYVTVKRVLTVTTMDHVPETTPVHRDTKVNCVYFSVNVRAWHLEKQLF